MTLSIGVDIGGTFTDVVAIDSEDGELLYTKVSSTPPGLIEGFFRSIDEALGLASASYGDVAGVVHGTTVGTNAILEAKGARIGILSTQGFEDVLAIGRQGRTEMYDVFLEAETPMFLAPRRRIVGIPERMLPEGEVDIPLDEDGVARAVDALVDEHGVQSIAVCYLFSFANPAHERRTGEIIAERHPDLHVSLSSTLDPRFREYERLCLTAFDAYLRPLMEGYVGELRAGLRSRGSRAWFHVMRSRGGTTGGDTVLENTVSTVLSGPAAGVVGGVFAAGLSGLEDLITLDMGGTSCDVALVERGRPVLSSEGKIARYPLRQPMLDLNTIGAGGGSIAWLDAGGALRVGPASAGADPGPACYGRGGERPTVTDASLVLGYLSPDYFAGGGMALDASLAEEAIARDVAGPLGMDAPAAAQGIHTIVNNHMADEIRLVSMGRGYDPRSFALVAMGGAGPLHAGRLARQSNVTTVLVPLSPGVQSALGLLVADLEYEAARTHRVRASDAAPDDIAAVFAELEASCRGQGERDWMQGVEIEVRRSVEMRYAGQSYELEVPFATGPVSSRGSMVEAVTGFHQAHERVYGHRDSDDLVELVTLRVTLAQTPPQLWRPAPSDEVDPDPAPALKGRRPAYFVEAGGYVDTPVYAREGLAHGMRLAGPAIVEQEDCTTLVYPGDEASVDRYGNILMEVQPAGA